MPGRMSTRPAGRRLRVSRLPALAALLLVVAVVTGVGLALADPAEDRPGTEISLGLRAMVYGGSGPAGYSTAEWEVLSGPLPADAVQVHVPVLMYHYVDETPPPAGPYADGLTVRTPDFAEELEYLANNGHHTVTLADAYLAMAGVKELPEKPVVLTFDDGGLDNYSVAFPLLEKYGFVATFFVITERVGANGQMTWEQLREMVEAGMCVQSHSVSHPGLTGLSDERLRKELVDSRATIEDALGLPGYVLCYPAGAYDDRVIEAARAAGYVMAVATDKGEALNPGAVFEIKRSRVQPYLSLTSFARLVE